MSAAHGLGELHELNTIQVLQVVQKRIDHWRARITDPSAPQAMAELQQIQEMLTLSDARLLYLHHLLALTAWVEVRCCCQPQKVLGWLPTTRKDVHVGSRRRFVRRDGQRTLELEIREWSRERLAVDGFLEMKRGLAYYSEDTPLEVLREIPEFIEAPPLQ